MDEKMIMEVYAAIDGDQKGNIATGYPVAPGRVLTARHALQLEDGTFCETIKVRWHHLKGRKGYGWQEATMIDCGLTDELDVALLACTFPEDIAISYPHLLKDETKGEFRWGSSGFPEVGKLNGIRKPTALWGGGKSDGVDAPVAKEEKWRGASGAPVFFSNKNTIVGIVSTCPLEFDAARLDAIPSWELLKCARFRGAIDFNRRDQAYATLHKAIVGIISKSQRVCVALGEALEISDCASCNEVVDRLTETDVDHALRVCESVFEDFVMGQSTQEAELVRRLIYLLLPVLFSPEVIKKVCETPQSFVCNIDIGTKSVAEVVMAARDGRALRFRDMAGEIPLGEFLLEDPPESQGIGSGNFIADFDQQMIKRYAPLNTLSDATQRKLAQEGKLSELAANKLKRLAEKDRQTRYYFFTPEYGSDRETQLRVINTLREKISRNSLSGVL